MSEASEAIARSGQPSSGPSCASPLSKGLAAFDFERVVSGQFSESTSLFTEFKKKHSTPRIARELVERLYFKKQIAENKLNFLRGEREYEQLRECTFSPQVARTSQRRSFKSFLSAQRKALLLSHPRPQPGLASPQFSKTSGNPLVHQRLYTAARLSKKPVVVSDEECTFSPRISPRARQFKRAQPVTEFLYQDAMERLRK